MHRKRCSVAGCEDKVSSMHRFPHPKSDAHGRFGKWVEAIGAINLKELDPMVVYQNRRVCGSHFSPDSYVSGERKLKRNAIPNFNVPVMVIEAEQVAGEEAPGTPNEVPAAETLLEFHTPVMLMEVEQVAGEAPGTPKEVPAPETPKEVPAPGTPKEVPAPETSTSFSGTGTSMTRRSLFPRASDTGCTRKGGVLHELGVKKLAELTPKAKFLYKTCQGLKKSIHRSSKKLVGVRKRLRLSEKCFKLGGGTSGELSQTVLSFLQSQVTQASKKGKGRRFTLDDKILALSLMKRSGGAYKFLSNVFALPSRRTLLRILSSLTFSTSINNGMFHHLSVTVSKKVKDIDRHCILMFHEMSLTPHLDFQDHLDLIEGFEDLGGELKSPRFAHKALVFMLRGLRRNYKQPVVYVLPSGSVKTPDLCTLIRNIIASIHSCGLTVHATVSDQGPANVAAINKLCAETRHCVLRSGEEYRGDYFDVDGMKIIPLFDPPHLMKGVRNGLLTKDLKYSSGGVNKVASWRHVLQLYNIDCGRFRALPKLTDLHVYPEKIPRMKVKHCTQVFSHQVASLMDMLSKRSIEGDLEAAAADTAELLEFFDRLFDSINGRSLRPPAGKPLRCAVSPSSGHMEFWNEAQKFLQSMVYSSGPKECRTPSLINWGRTIGNIKSLWLNLHNLGFKSLALRNLNQDPLENKFGSIRSYGFRNNAPTCSHFVGAYKSLLLNDMVAAHSVGSNCLEDDCEVLDNLRSYLTAPRSSSTAASSLSEVVDEALLEETSFMSVSSASSEVISDMPGMSTTMPLAAISAGDLLKLLGPAGCIECKRKQCSFITNDNGATSTPREQETALRGSCHPSDSFTEVFSMCRDIILKELPCRAHMLGIGTHLKKAVFAQVDFRYICCDVHHANVREKFVKAVVKQTVIAWCTSINRYLMGRDTRTTSTLDTIHQEAHNYYTKRHKSKR